MKIRKQKIKKEIFCLFIIILLFVSYIYTARRPPQSSFYFLLNHGKENMPWVKRKKKIKMKDGYFVKKYRNISFFFPLIWSLFVRVHKLTTPNVHFHTIFETYLDSMFTSKHPPTHTSLSVNNWHVYKQG